MKTLDQIIDQCRCAYGKDGDCQGKVELHGAMTAYHYEGEKNGSDDPNKDFYACERHYDDYYTYWREQWDEYYSTIRSGL